MINSPIGQKAINILIDNGFKAYFVGGMVRDAYLRMPVHDVDITTSATPTEVTAVFKNANYTVIPTGLKHGTVTVLIDGENIEITTFRTESGYDDNRHPKNVQFVRDIEGDLSRRDFTVNAMAYNDKEGIIDLYGGKNDCDSKILRAVGNADERFKEDALRILRAVRFASKLGFTIEKETAKAMIKNVELLNNISKERIYSELLSIITSAHAEEVLLKYKKIFFTIIPELARCDGFDQKSKYHAYDVYTHIVKTVSGADNDKIVRLACLLHDIAKPLCFTLDEFKRGHFYGHPEKSAEMAVAILTRLKADNKTIKTVESVISLHDTVISSNPVKVKRFLRDYGIEILEVLTKVRVADALAHANAYVAKRAEASKEVLCVAKTIIENNECYSLSQLAVKGSDIVALGYKGEEIKKTLNKLLNGVIENKYINDKNYLLKVLK